LRTFLRKEENQKREKIMSEQKSSNRDSGTPEVQQAQERSRNRLMQLQAAKDYIQEKVAHGDKPNTYKLELNHEQVSELNEILSQT